MINPERESCFVLSVDLSIYTYIKHIACVLHVYIMGLRITKLYLQSFTYNFISIACMYFADRLSSIAIPKKSEYQIGRREKEKKKRNNK